MRLAQKKNQKGPRVKEFGFCLEGNHRRILSWECVSYEDSSDCSMKNGPEG